MEFPIYSLASKSRWKIILLSGEKRTSNGCTARGRELAYNSFSAPKRVVGTKAAAASHDTMIRPGATGTCGLADPQTEEKKK